MTPLMLDVGGRHVLCVGAGPVAAAKVLPLAADGAVVTVVAPEAVAALRSAGPGVRWERRGWRDTDLDADPPVMLAVAATGEPEIDAAVAEQAARRGIWCLRTDGLGNVAVPSVIRRERLVLAIATGVPALTRALRAHLEAELDSAWPEAAAVLGELRADPAVRAQLDLLPPAERRDRWRRAVADTLDADSSGDRNPGLSALTGPEPRRAGGRRHADR